MILFEKYIDKWILNAKKAKADKGLEEVAAGLKEDEAAQAQPKKKQNSKTYGIYTKSGRATVSTVDGRGRARLDSTNSTNWCSLTEMTSLQSNRSANC